MPDPPELPPHRTLDELDVLERIEAQAFAARREIRSGDAATARARCRELRVLVAQLPR